MRPETEAALTKARALVKAGTSVVAACKASGITGTTYRNYKAKRLAPKKRLKLEEIPLEAASGTRVIALVGEPRAVAEMLGRLQ